jgi:hypothetical protein
MGIFYAIRANDARRYGREIRALAISNREYQDRFNRLGKSNKMKPPPGSHIHIMPGYLVVRKVGTSDQYETWMPDHVFEELYEQRNKPKANDPDKA